ncbi:MAG: hybrid sensor histidine kinase/response regulator [Phycisphaerae bacterium]
MSDDKNGRIVLTGGMGQAVELISSATGQVWTDEFFKHVVCSMDEGVLVVDIDENILFANPATARIVGHPHARVVGMNLSEFVLPEEFPHILAETERRMSGRTSRYRTRIRRSDGDIRDIDVTSSPLRGADGEVIAAAGVFMDVTEQRRAEEALERSERDKAVILSSISELVNYQDTDLRVRWANRAAAESVGQNPEDLVGRFCYEIWHGCDRPCENCPVLKSIRTGRSQEGETTTPDGRVWRIRAYPVRDEAGDIVGSVEITLDVTEQVRAAEALQHHTDRLEALNGLDRAILSARSLTEVCQAAMSSLHSLIDCTRSAVIEFDLDRRTATVLATRSSVADVVPTTEDGDVLPLDAFQDIDGYVHNRPRLVSDLVHLEDPNELQKMLLERGVKGYFSVPMLADGRLIGVLSLGFDSPDAFSKDDIDIASEVANPVAIAIDRERRERERARLAAAMQQTGAAVAILGPTGLTEYVNPAAERIMGFSQEEIRRQEHESFLADDTARLLYQEMRREVGQGRTWSGRANLRRCDGSVFPADVSCSPLRDAQGRITSYILVGHDASDKAALETQLRQSQKMEAIGRLAGGVAHDFNNILTVILGNAELLEQSHGCDPQVAPAVTEIRRAGQQAAELTRQLLAFARKGKFSVATVDLHETISEVMAMLKSEAGSNIQLVTDLSADAPWTVGDATQLKMALLNLGINACDAMDGGGTLTFATRNVTVEQDGGADDGVSAGQYVEISVSDTGCGMDEATRARIFEPFFTTKELGRGTGLGLAGVYGCVKYHGGSVTVDTAPQQGTTFRLLLPFGEVKSQATEEPAPAGIPERGRILVVDDDDQVRGFTTRALTRAGFEVTDCGDPAEALAIYRRDPSRFSLVIVDLIMPHISGRELFGRIKHLNPYARVAVTTGAERDHMVRGLLAAGAVGFIPKPFDSDSLLASVERFLTVPQAGKIA